METTEVLIALGFAPEQIEARRLAYVAPPIEPDPQRSEAQELALIFRDLFRQATRDYGREKAMQLLKDAHAYQVMLMKGGTTDQTACQWCGKPMTKATQRQRYHGPRCRKAASLKRKGSTLPKVA